MARTKLTAAALVAGPPWIQYPPGMLNAWRPHRRHGAAYLPLSFFARESAFDIISAARLPLVGQRRVPVLDWLPEPKNCKCIIAPWEYRQLEEPLDSNLGGDGETRRRYGSLARADPRRHHHKAL